MAEGDRKARETRCFWINAASVAALKSSGITSVAPASRVGSTRPEPGPVRGRPSMFTSWRLAGGRKSMDLEISRTLSRYLRLL
ncbi:hypothetical protein D3C72_2224400 [compost metagenome]